MSDAGLGPLFSLYSVLFSGQLLPLVIFEPRYRTMINECLEGEPVFGAVLIREGQEVGETALPYETGTMARIRRVERMEDGRMYIVCLGEVRFRIHSLDYSRPFLQGQIDLWPWATPEEARMVEPALDLPDLSQLLNRYMRLLASATGNRIELKELPADPLPLATLAAIALQIGNEEKQMLLTRPTLYELVESCSILLKRENRALQVAAAVPGRWDEYKISPN
jgi:Lon protease-like protein